MHFLALVLAATVVATPVPSPAPLQALKVIGSVRSTPFCTELHEIIGPAIVSVLGIAVTVTMLPETSGRSLEELSS